MLLWQSHVSFSFYVPWSLVLLSCLWRSHLLQCLQSDFRKVIVSPAACLDILRISHTYFMAKIAPQLLFPIGKQLLRMHSFYWSCKARLGAQSLSSIFSRVVSRNAHFGMPSPNLTDSGLLSMHAWKLFGEACIQFLQGYTQETSDRVVGEVYVALGVSTACLGALDEVS